MATERKVITIGETVVVTPVISVNSKPDKQSKQQTVFEPLPKNKGGRPKTQFKKITKSSQDGTKQGEVRATFIVREDLLDKLKRLSFWNRTMIKEEVNKALDQYIARYEEQNGTIKPITK